MRIMKFSHSCVRLDGPAGAVLVDPGTYAEDGELERAADGLDAVLVTHEHPDHLDADRLGRLLADRPEVRVWGPAPVRDLLPEHADQVTVVTPGESFTAGGLPVRTLGGQHALIHPSVPVVPNLAYVVDQTVLHPGDSLVVPAEPVTTLLLPLHAPWSRVSEVLDHVVAVRAPTVHAIHDGLLNERGRAVVEGHVRRVAEQYGCDYRPLAVGESDG